MPAPRRQFETLRASSLYCRACGQAMPVREKLLLVVPGKEIYDYVCVKCGASLGKREVGEEGGDAPRLWVP